MRSWAELPVATMRLVLVLLIAASSAQAQSVEARLDDLRLATAVRLALVADASTRALDVDVDAAAGAVRLSGDGASDARAMQVAQAVPGVRSVNGRGGERLEAPVSRAEPRVDEPRAEAPQPVSAPRTETPRPAASRTEAPAARGGWGAAPAVPPASSGDVFHSVARGETLFSLARRYETSVEALRRLNGLGPTDGIEVGQRLRVR